MAAPVARWRLSAGDEFGLVERLLRPNGDSTSPVFPCPECGRDLVVLLYGAEFVAEPDEDVPCRGVAGLSTVDVTEHTLDWPLVLGWLGAMFGCRLERAGVQYGQVVAGGEIVCGFRRVAVRMCFCDDAGMIGEEAAKWVAMAPRPALFLTARHHGGCVAVFARTGCAYVALEDVIGVDDAGAAVLVRSIEELVGETERGGLERGCADATLERIDRKLAVVVEQKRELIEENDDLKTMQARGMFKFVASVDSDDMRLFLAILAHGDQSKAARAMGMRDSTFRAQTQGWKVKGPSYRVMYRLIEWRKAVGGKRSVIYDDRVLMTEDGAKESHEALLDQVLEGLREMNARNWAAVSRELLEAVEEVHPG